MWVYAAERAARRAVGRPLLAQGPDPRGTALLVGGDAGDGLCARYWQLVAVRAIEGLGESFYFPASMSLISDYHGNGTRSRAMSIHQSSVYAGTIAGGTLAGYLGQYRLAVELLRLGWGGFLAMVLLGLLREPERGASEPGGRAAEPGSAWRASRGVFRHPWRRC